MGPLVNKILEINEPDKNRRLDWMEQKRLNPASSAPCMKKASAILQRIRREGKKVLVCGDYDADGICATTIMCLGLKQFGIKVGFFIPNRIRDGYGLNCRAVQLAKKSGYEYIVTVDNGVTATETLSEARKQGIGVIVTDHHSYAAEPDCEAFVHPSVMEDCFSSLCGAGVAFELLRCLHVHDPYFMVLAGIASVTDVMPVTGQTRALIQQTCAYLNQTGDYHIQGLYSDVNVTETTIGFQIGPKLNSFGRLADEADPKEAVRALASNDPVKVMEFFRRADDLNRKRKEMTEQAVLESKEHTRFLGKLCFVQMDDLHEGIVGLVAGRHQNQHHCPCLAMCRSGSVYKGSMRSSEAFNCIEFLQGFDKYEGVGGHKGAAGLSVREENMEDFIRFLDEKMKDWKWQEEEKPSVHVSADDLTLDAVNEIDRLRPFGTGFEMPSIVLDAPKIEKVTDMKGGLHRKYICEGGIDCLRFSQPETERSLKPESIASFSGSVSINAFRGNCRVNLMVDSIQTGGIAG